MGNRHRTALFAVLTLIALFTNLLGVNSSFAHSSSHSSLSSPQATGGNPNTVRMVSMHTVKMRDIPVISGGHAPQGVPPSRPEFGFNPVIAQQDNAIALHNRQAPRVIAQAAGPRVPTSQASTPGTINSFQGMADSTTICPPLGCEPPDMAVAASSQWVLQGVNASFDVHSAGGTHQAGWPKSARSFFGVPNPDPNPGQTPCTSPDPNVPYLTDPRTFYDPIDGRFWAAIAEWEGVPASHPNCAYKNLYWIAVSQTGDPNGGWYVYAFDMRAGLNVNYIADYVQFGFDQRNIYFDANMFTTDGTTFQYAEIEAASKSTMESGQFTSFYGFWGLWASVNRRVNVDTVQPINTGDGSSYALFINAFNGGRSHQHNGDPYNDDCISSACHGLVVWSIANAATPSERLSGVIINTNNYILPPLAAQSGSNQQINTGDTRMSGTPPYHNGLISFALNTAVNNGSNQNVSAIYWGQVFPYLNGDGTIAGAVLYQQGVYAYSGTSSTYYGALMPDWAGNLVMVFEFSSSTFSPGSPSVAYVTRHLSDTLGSFDDNGLFLKAGDGSYGGRRWGDYEATSFTGLYSNTIWFAGQYATTGHDWSTYVGAVKF